MKTMKRLYITHRLFCVCKYQDNMNSWTLHLECDHRNLKYLIQWLKFLWDWVAYPNHHPPPPPPPPSHSFTENRLFVENIYLNNAKYSQICISLSGGLGWGGFWKFRRLHATTGKSAFSPLI